MGKPIVKTHGHPKARSSIKAIKSNRDLRDHHPRAFEAAGSEKHIKRKIGAMLRGLALVRLSKEHPKMVFLTKRLRADEDS